MASNITSFHCSSFHTVFALLKISRLHVLSVEVQVIYQSSHFLWPIILYKSALWWKLLTLLGGVFQKRKKEKSVWGSQNTTCIFQTNTIITRCVGLLYIISYSILVCFWIVTKCNNCLWNSPCPCVSGYDCLLEFFFKLTYLVEYCTSGVICKTTMYQVI